MRPFRPLATLALGLGSLLFAGAAPAGAVTTTAAPAQAPLVMLDPAHGGADRGAVVGGAREADLTLDLAKRTAALLQAAGCRTALTRDSDGPSVAERVLHANRLRPACLVSLHLNQSPSAASKGWRVFVPSVAGGAQTVQGTAGDTAALLPWGQAQALAAPRSRQLGEAVAAAMEAGAARGVQALRLEVFRGLACPAVVLEAGFMTQPEELERLKSEAGRQELAKRLSQGVQSWLKARGELP